MTLSPAKCLSVSSAEKFLSEIELSIMRSRNLIGLEWMEGIENKTSGRSDAFDTEKVVVFIDLPFEILEMLLIICRTNLILTSSATCVITISKGAGTYAITDAKLYVPVVTLSINDNTKLLKKLKPDFKRTINWNKYQSRVTLKIKKQYLIT